MDRGKEGVEFERRVASAAVNWTAAQSIPFSIDLIAASLRLRHFLAAVNRCRSFYSGPSVSRAIRRYEHCWLPLLADHPDHPVIPPLDCAWIWYCHRLNPLAYARDCKRIYGRLLGAPPHADDTSNDDAEALRYTRHLWEKRFPYEPFEIDHHHHSLSLDLTAPPTQQKSRIEYDLHSAVGRQSSFYYQIAERHMGDERFLRAAEQRYKAFLYLLKLTESKVFLVPTYDIDLMWHAHQLHPQAYAHDTEALLGKVLQHDDTDSDRSHGQKLDAGFRRTSRTWFESYCSVYERAGAMYRGEPPQHVDRTTIEAGSISTAGADSSSVDIETFLDRAPVTIREVMKVHLSLVGVRNVNHSSLPKGSLRACVRLQSKCSAFILETPSIKLSSASQTVWWNEESWRFEAEKSTEAVCVELVLKPSNLIDRMVTGSRMVLGRLELPWKSVLESPTLSLDGWFKLKTPASSSASPYLLLSLSVTPPVPAPQLFRTINSIPTDDTGKMDLLGRRMFAKRNGCWLTRTVLDHSNREVFIVRVRYSDGQAIRYKRTPESEKCIHIHRGRWVYHDGRRKAGTAPADIVASAQQIVTGTESKQAFANERRWGFLGNTSQLIVRRPVSSDPSSISSPLLEIRGSLASKVSLASGRKLKYEVKGAKDADEAGFVTVIRHHPSGESAASALFNWRTGVVEVLPYESVVLVLLLSAIICSSIFDMEGLKVKLVAGSSRRKEAEDKSGGDEWESVTVESGGAEKEMAPYVCWWEVAGKDWASAFYNADNEAFFGASGCGAAGACGSGGGGACGGSACGGASGCGGGGGGGGGCGGGGGGGGCGGGGGGGGGCGGGGGGGS